MTSFPKVKSILTDRYQTTVPEPVRRALYLGKGDKLHYTILPGGEVMLSRAQKMEEDPLLGRFLEFLARDIANNPRRLQSVDADLVTRINNLVGKMTSTLMFICLQTMNEPDTGYQIRPAHHHQCRPIWNTPDFNERSKYQP